LSVKLIGQNIELDNQLASRENQQAEIDKNNIKEKP
jgi:hypothetical protein